MNKQKLAACAIFDNAARLLPEWLAYHRLVGVDHLVLYDSSGTGECAQVLHDSPVAVHATLIRWPQLQGRIAAYRHFIDIFAPGFEWAAFIDVDQFLVPLDGRSVVDTLEWLSSAAAVLVHRRVFGPGTDASPGLVIETHDRRAADAFPAHRHVRVIARCSELLDVTQQPHEFRVNGPVFNTAGHLAPNQAVQSVPCFQNLVINQYCVTAGSERLTQVLADGVAANAGRPVDADAVAALSEQRDDAIKAFTPAVRDLLGSGPAAVPAAGAAGVGPTTESSAAAAITPAQAALAPQPGVPQAEIDVAPGWLAAGLDGQTRVGGLALVFRDRSRPGEHWLAALRGAAAGGIDPAFLTDDYDRICDFPTDAEARTACDTALATRLKG